MPNKKRRVRAPVGPWETFIAGVQRHKKMSGRIEIQKIQSESIIERNPQLHARYREAETIMNSLRNNGPVGWEEARLRLEINSTHTQAPNFDEEWQTDTILCHFYEKSEPIFLIRYINIFGMYKCAGKPPLEMTVSFGSRKIHNVSISSNYGVPIPLCVAFHLNPSPSFWLAFQKYIQTPLLASDVQRALDGTNYCVPLRWNDFLLCHYYETDSTYLIQQCQVKMGKEQLGDSFLPMRMFETPGPVLSVPFFGRVFFH